MAAITDPRAAHQTGCPARGRIPIVLTLLCRDEIDIVKAHLKFHLALGVDAFIVTDNGSTDGTYELLSAYRGACNILLLREPELIHDQGRWVTRMARTAFEMYGQCWLIHSDADEFWLPDSGDLPTWFSLLPPDMAVVCVKRLNMLPPPPHERDQPVPFFARQFIKESRSCNALGHPLPGKVVHLAMPDVSIADGNHAVYRGSSRLSAVPARGLQIIHYPVRSLAQLELKIRQGASALERNPNLAAGVGLTWRVLADRLRKEGSLHGYYESLFPGEEAVKAGLKSGSYIKEDRIFKILTDPALVRRRF